MTRNLLRLLITVAVSTLASRSQAADQMIGAYAEDGGAFLLKRFHLVAGTVLTGSRFESNDVRTVFPNVALVPAAPSVDIGSALAAAQDVQSLADGIVTVSWVRPVRVPEDGAYDLLIRLPVGQRRLAIGEGAGIGANRSRETAGSGGSFAAGSDGRLVPIGLDLAIDLLLDPVAKPIEATEERASSGRDVFLRGGRPNPSTTVARVEFGVDQLRTVILAIYDVAGRQVRLLAREQLASGVYTREWDGRDARGHTLPAGVYFVRLSVGDRTLTEKIVLSK